MEQVSGFSLDSGKKGSNFEKTNTEPEDMVEDDDEVPAKKSKVDGELKEHFLATAAMESFCS